MGLDKIGGISSLTLYHCKVRLALPEDVRPQAAARAGGGALGSQRGKADHTCACVCTSMQTWPRPSTAWPPLGSGLLAAGLQSVTGHMLFHSGCHSLPQHFQAGADTCGGLRPEHRHVGPLPPACSSSCCLWAADAGAELRASSLDPKGSAGHCASLSPKVPLCMCGHCCCHQVCSRAGRRLCAPQIRCGVQLAKETGADPCRPLWSGPWGGFAWDLLRRSPGCNHGGPGRGHWPTWTVQSSAELGVAAAITAELHFPLPATQLAALSSSSRHMPWQLPLLPSSHQGQPGGGPSEQQVSPDSLQAGPDPWPGPCWG